MKDSLGQRMKEQYEVRSRQFLPRRTYTILRLDGKAFHSYTRNLKKPFDNELIEAMNYGALKLCEEIQGTVMAYVQSDEMSLLLTDFEKNGTEAWFNGNVQKMVSVSASILTAAFNQKRGEQGYREPAYFDARCFTIPDPIEVENYFIWRQKDAVKNSISMAALTYYSHQELNSKNGNEKQEMLFQKGVNWNDFPAGFKRGRVVEKSHFEVGDTLRSKWEVTDAYEFTKDREKLGKSIPKYQIEY